MGGLGRGSGGRHLLILAALGLVVLAGCLGGGDDTEALNETNIEAADAEGASGTQASGSDTGSQPALAFAGPADVEQVNESGSFSAGDGAFLGGYLRGADTREHDLTQHVATQTPVSINVTITYSGEISQLNGYWSMEGVEILDQHYHKDFATNTIWMEALVARASNGGTVTAVVQADTAGASPEREYTLDAQIRAHGDALVPLVPASIPVTEDSGGFVLDPAEDAELGEALVWDAQGAFVDRMQPQSGTITVDVGEEDPTGRYTVLVRAAEDSLQVPTTSIQVRPANASNPPDRPMEIVPIQDGQGDWQQAAAGETATWSFERESPPVQAGIVMEPTTAFGAAAGPGSYAVSLSSPAGTVVESSGGGFIITGGSLIWMSAYADEALAAGTYEAEASVGLGTDHQATHIVRELAP